MDKHDAREHTTYVVATLLAVALCIASIWLVRYPPLVDYPNHLARCYILFHLHEVPEFQQLYTADWAPVPNLAMDVLVYLLQYLFDVEVAGKIVLSLIVLLFAVGAVGLSLTLWGRVIWSVPLVVSFALNSTFLYGFINYCLGIGLYLFLFAIWLRWSNMLPFWSVLMTLLFAVICYFTHLSAYACFAISVLLHLMLVRRCVGRPLVHAAALVVLSLIFWLLGSDTRYSAPILWNTVVGKISIALPMVRTYSWQFDLAYLLITSAGLVTLLLSGRPLQVKKRTLLLAALFALLYAVLPKEMATVSGVDARFVLPGAIMFLLSVTPDNAFSVRTGRFAVFAVYAFVFLRLAYVGWQWNAIDIEARNYVHTFASFRHGSWVYPIVELPQDVDENKRYRSFTHFIHYSTIYQKTFSPTLFTIPGQQPLRRKVAEPYREAVETSLEYIEWDDVLRKYDYLWCYNVRQNTLEQFPGKLHLVSRVGNVTVYEVRKAKELGISHARTLAATAGDNPRRRTTEDTH